MKKPIACCNIVISVTFAYPPAAPLITLKLSSLNQIFTGPFNSY